jgi:predicted ribosomally synthesized peptide with SipW-like signal peptide
VRRTTAWALGGVLAGTVLLGAGGTMATFSDSEALSATVGAGSVDLAVVPTVARSTAMTAGEPLTLTVDASSAGAPASLQLTAVDDPGSDACGLGDGSLTASVSADWMPALAPVPLCQLLDAGHPVVLAHVGPAAPLADALLEVRLDRPDGQPVVSSEWSGSLTFTLVQGAAGFSVTQAVPLHVAGVDPAGAVNGSDVPAPQVAGSVSPEGLGTTETASDPAPADPAAESPAEEVDAGSDAGPAEVD